MDKLTDAQMEELKGLQSRVTALRHEGFFFCVMRHDGYELEKEK